MTQPTVGTRMVRAADNRDYAFWIDEYQRRWWKCVEDPSVLIPYCVLEVPDGISTRDNPMRPARDAWNAGIAGPGPLWE